MEDYRQYLDPKVLNKVSGLELKARLAVEGFVSGRHESPLKGSSVEFREHREYVPGDDIRFLDWKVYGKTDRFYIKEYDEETSLRAYMVLDTSESMAYGSSEVTKLEYAKFVASALTHLVTQQQDEAALVLWDEQLRTFLPPSNNPLHVRDIYRNLAEAKPSGKTDLGRLLAEVSERLRQKSLIILLSDLFDDRDESFARGLKYVRHKGHDVIVFHVLDEAELTFPFERMTQFEGLEVEDKLLADPKALRSAYLEEMGRFLDGAKAVCNTNRMDYVRLDTSAPLDVALSGYLAARAGAR
jgi:uncharacterized protein (DUF58 family)